MSGTLKYTVLTSSPEETEAVGRAVGEAIGRSEEKPFLALYGDLGAGKTVCLDGTVPLIRYTFQYTNNSAVRRKKQQNPCKFSLHELKKVFDFFAKIVEKYIVL